ncbi:MAG: PAS domain S-box protein [Bradyrhizobiaceae bacterium]|nr:PAS domain S-box protein [Bradyrhizobiaceae bacterium]
MSPVSISADERGVKDDLSQAQAIQERHKQPRNPSFRKILEALPAAIYVTDADGRIVFYNRSAAELWGVWPTLGEDQFCGSWKLHRMDGAPLPHNQSPMAVALQEKRHIRGAEAIAERPDGRRVPFLAYPTPIFDAAGNVAGAVNLLLDLTERKEANEAVQRLAAIVESSDDAIIAKDLNGTIVSWNRGAEKLFGYSAEEAIGHSVTMLIPRDRCDEEPSILARVRRGEHIDHYETIRRRKDGSLVEISLSVSPLRDRGGRIVGASKIARDITERRRMEEQQQLLIREMDHRVKNAFVLASSLVALSARHTNSPAELVESVSARLEALEHAHSMTVPKTCQVTGENEQSTTLYALIGVTLAPYRYSSDLPHDRVTITGPDISIRGNAITSIALLLHEFTTNAVKYGSLACMQGCIDISGRNDGEYFILDWVERGGSDACAQKKDQGFGTLLSNAVVRGQLGGEITREWKPEGLSVRLKIRRDRLAS